MLAPKLRKSADKSLSQPWCIHSNTIYEIQLQKTIVYACSCGTKQPWHSYYNAICRDWVAKHDRTTLKWQHQMTTIMQPFQCDLQPQIQETHRTTHTDTTTHCRTQEELIASERPQPQPLHRRGTFHRRLQPLYTEKRTVSCSGFLPQRIAHATCMQPLQCDLQPQIQETHRITHTDTNTQCRAQRRNRSRPERPQPHPPHRRGTFHRRLQPLYTEKRTVSCSSFLPNTSPMQHSCMHFAASRGKLTRWQQSCSHSNAICSHRFKKRIELRTQTQPLIAERRGGTDRVRNDPSRHRRTDAVPFILGCNHFTRRNTRFRAPASSPKQSPCNIHAAIARRSAATDSRNT